MTPLENDAWNKPVYVKNTDLSSDIMKPEVKIPNALSSKLNIPSDGWYCMLLYNYNWLSNLN